MAKELGQAARTYDKNLIYSQKQCVSLAKNVREKQIQRRNCKIFNRNKFG